MIDIENVRLASIELYDRALNGSKEILSLIEWNDTIKKALTELERLQKKEVPMKVNITNPMDDWHPCPNCGYLVLHSIDKHCSTCGQKLDWSDEK